MFDKIFTYGADGATSGAELTGGIQDVLFAGSEKTKFIRETSPEAARVGAGLTGFLGYSKNIANEQKKEAADSAGRAQKTYDGAKETADKNFKPYDEGIKRNPYPDYAGPVKPRN